MPGILVSKNYQEKSCFLAQFFVVQRSVSCVTWGYKIRLSSLKNK